MNSGGLILLLAGALAVTSCKKLKTSLQEFSKGGESEVAALPDSESLAGAEGLPVVREFKTVTPESIGDYIAAGDRISVVEFYSDT